MSSSSSSSCGRSRGLSAPTTGPTSPMRLRVGLVLVLTLSMLAAPCAGQLLTCNELERRHTLFLPPVTPYDLCDAVSRARPSPDDRAAAAREVHRLIEDQSQDRAHDSSSRLAKLGLAANCVFQVLTLPPSSLFNCDEYCVKKVTCFDHPVPTVMNRYLTQQLSSYVKTQPYQESDKSYTFGLNYFPEEGAAYRHSFERPYLESVAHLIRSRSANVLSGTKFNLNSFTAGFLHKDENSDMLRVINGLLNAGDGAKTALETAASMLDNQAAARDSVHQYHLSDVVKIVQSLESGGPKKEEPSGSHAKRIVSSLLEGANKLRNAIGAFNTEIRNERWQAKVHDPKSVKGQQLKSLMSQVVAYQDMISPLDTRVQPFCQEVSDRHEALNFKRDTDRQTISDNLKAAVLEASKRDQQKADDDYNSVSARLGRGVDTVMDTTKSVVTVPFKWVGDGLGAVFNPLLSVASSAGAVAGAVAGHIGNKLDQQLNGGSPGAKRSQFGSDEQWREIWYSNPEHASNSGSWWTKPSKRWYESRRKLGP